jgi:histidine triad (HIT) family protein
MTTVFQQIIDGKLPATKVWESDTILAIRDLHPVAPVHVLILPKKAVSNLDSLEEKDWPLMLEVVKAAQLIAQQEGIAGAYRLLTNCGREAGQTIFHLHFHLIGGRMLGALG